MPLVVPILLLALLALSGLELLTDRLPMLGAEGGVWVGIYCIDGDWDEAGADWVASIDAGVDMR